MMARCIICKEQFAQIENERRCQNHKHGSIMMQAGNITVNRMRRYFNNPIYQFFKLVIPDEDYMQMTVPYKCRNISLFKRWERLAKSI